MSQKEQEAAIDERIERIRKRNEEIQRRYLEVEADKLNAEKLNAAVKFSPSPAKNPDTERKSYNKSEITNRNPRFERKYADKPYVPKHQVHGQKSSFADNDKPPPDPVYTFLSDSSRDSPRVDHPSEEKPTQENFSGGDFRGSRGGGRGRGWSRGRVSSGRGGKRGPGNQQSRQSPQMQPDYQAWRAEREKIDQDRITRQKTAEGNWRREWDMKKLSQDEDPDFHSRPAYSKKKRRESDELKIQRTVVNELASPTVKDQEGKSPEKSVLAKPCSKGSSGEKKTVVFKVNEDQSSGNGETQTQDTSFEHRNIVTCGDSIKVQLSNKPIKSVKVNPLNSAGTGRVGPRQKPRLSYSSQSEDEKEVRPPILRKKGHGNQVDQAKPVPDDVSKKPPLPPRANNGSPQKQVIRKSTPSINKETESPSTEGKELSRGSSHENISEAGDDSWEDVATTSGNESADYSDADVAKKSNNERVSQAENFSDSHDMVEGNESNNESIESSALKSSEIKGFQPSRLEEGNENDAKISVCKEGNIQDLEQKSYEQEYLEENGLLEDEKAGKMTDNVDCTEVEEDIVNSSLEIINETKEQVNLVEKTEVMPDADEQGKVVLTSAENFHDNLNCDDAAKQVESSQISGEHNIGKILNAHGASNEDSIAKETNSSLKNIVNDEKDQDVSNNKTDTPIPDECNSNLSVNNEILQAQGNPILSEPENCIGIKSEDASSKGTEGIDVCKIESDSHLTGELEET